MKALRYFFQPRERIEAFLQALPPPHSLSPQETLDKADHCQHLARWYRTEAIGKDLLQRAKIYFEAVAFEASPELQQAAHFGLWQVQKALTQREQLGPRQSPSHPQEYPSYPDPSDIKKISVK